ncbi:MAG: response regulator transcription factor [Candidatus Aminicenantes bacterium]|jgi:FixJ family two-component response regulator
MNDSKKIYIVDDDLSVRKALRRLLTSVGYDVETYASSQEFLDSVPQNSQGCLILDMRMPGLNGLGLQSKMASMNYKLPIIFITAYDNPQDRKKAMDAGAISFLRKPFSDQELVDAIQSAFN